MFLCIIDLVPGILTFAGDFDCSISEIKYKRISIFFLVMPASFNS